MPKEEETDGLIQRSIRLPASLWARIEAHGAKLSARAGGVVKVSYNAAVTDLINTGLRETEGAPEPSPAKPRAKRRA